jgi:hypothetical protein
VFEARGGVIGSGHFDEGVGLFGIVEAVDHWFLRLCVCVCVCVCVCARARGVCVCVCVSEREREREREIERTVVMPAAVMAELKNSVSLLSLKLAGRLVTCSLFAL